MDPDIHNYKLFTTPTCHKCPAMKKYMKKSGLKGEVVDATTPEGRKQATELWIQSVPMVVFFNKEGRELFRGQTEHNIKQCFK